MSRQMRTKMGWAAFAAVLVGVVCIDRSDGGLIMLLGRLLVLAGLVAAAALSVEWVRRPRHNTATKAGGTTWREDRRGKGNRSRQKM